MRNFFALVACIILGTGIFAQTNEIKDAQVIIDTLHYDGPNFDGIGLGSAATFEVYAFFPASMLAAHHTAGNTIKSIDLFIKGASNVVSATIKIRPNQSSVSYSQSFTAGEGWNNIVLTTPFAIPASDLYVGYELVISGGFPLGCDAGPVNTNANWILYSGSWLHLTDLNAAMTYNWNIRARVDGSAGPSNDATLSDLKVDGTTIAGFSPNTLTYSKTYPYGTTTIPVVTATTNDPTATKVITNATSMPGTATVLVTAQDGTTQKTYTVNFLVAAPSTDATLSDLKVDGTTISGFNPSTYTYTLAYPYGTTTIPVVTATTNHASATHVVTNATSMPGSATVVVTAQDGTTQLTYAVNFTVNPPATDATLAGLYVDGSLVPGFSPATYNYTITLPYGTTVVPVVTATTNDVNATFNVNAASSLPGLTTVVVTAQDGTTSLSYSVQFNVAAAGSDATLSALFYDGTPVPGFSPAVTDYNIQLPQGTTLVPPLTATTSDANATLIITDATALPGTSTVVVTAQDGTTTSTYSVNFTVLVGIDETAGSDFSVYPVPTDGMVYIDSDIAFDYVLRDITGKEMTRGKAYRQISLSEFPAGIYMLEITQNEITFTTKVVKQ